MTDNRTKVVFVCTTNTMRSVMAQFVLDRFGYSKYVASSAGLFASGIPMSNNLAEVLSQKGYPKKDIQSFRSTQIDEEILNSCDVVYCATESHKSILENKYPQFSDKYRTFSSDLPDVFTTDQIDSLLYTIKSELFNLFSLKDDSIDYKIMDKESMLLAWELEKETFAHPFDIPNESGELCRLISVYSYNVFCGYLNYRHVLDEAEVMTIAVRPEYRRHGLGQELMNKMISDCRNDGIKTIFLEARKNNVAARAMYEKIGFSVIGLRKDYYDTPVDDAVVYKLDLVE